MHKAVFDRMVEKFGSELAVKNLAPNVKFSKDRGGDLILVGTWSELTKFQSLCSSTLARSKGNT